MHKAIEASNLTKYYGDLLAVDHVSFEMRRGEVFGFLGPNGAGKTTTIRMLTGLSRPTKGTARVLDFDVDSEIVKAKKHIGVVPESSNLYGELSAMDNLLFMAQLYGVPRGERRARAEQLLRTLALYERRDSLFSTFSRGMKRALTIAAALIHRPQLLFLDEPTVGLDVVAAHSLRSLIGDLHDRGISIFLTTHYLEEADLLCDRIAILVKGGIVKIDTPSRLKAVTEEESVIEVSFKGRISGRVEELSERLSGLQIATMHDDRVRIYGGAAAHVLGTVLHFAQDRNIEVDSVNSVRPSLEDAFIKIAGLSPSVMAVEKGARK